MSRRQREDFRKSNGWSVPGDTTYPTSIKTVTAQPKPINWSKYGNISSNNLSSEITRASTSSTRQDKGEENIKGKEEKNAQRFSNKLMTGIFGQSTQNSLEYMTSVQTTRQRYHDITCEQKQVFTDQRKEQERHIHAGRKESPCFGVCATELMEKTKEIEDLQKRIRSLQSENECLKQENKSLEESFKMENDRLQRRTIALQSGHDNENCNQQPPEKEKTSQTSHTMNTREFQNQMSKKCQEIEDLCKTVGELRVRNAYLEQENSELRRRSNKITREMALKTEISGRFENVTNEYSNTNIAAKLQKLYSSDWAKLSMLLRKALPKHFEEFDRIKLLSSLIKLSYDTCEKLHEEQLRQLQFLDRKGPVSLREDNILQVVLSAPEGRQLTIEDNKGNVNDKLRDFFENLIDCCWQVVAISNPPMVLNFDVVGKPFEEVSLYWTQYSTKKPVVDKSKDEGTIVLVVWPSVEMKEKSKYYNKGDAVVVTIGKKSNRDNELQQARTANQDALSEYIERVETDNGDVLHG